MSVKDDDRQRVKLAQLVGQLRDELPAHVEMAGMQAKLMRARYQALVREGFTEAQALELCKTPSGL